MKCCAQETVCSTFSTINRHRAKICMSSGQSRWQGNQAPAQILKNRALAGRRAWLPLSAVKTMMNGEEEYGKSASSRNSHSRSKVKVKRSRSYDRRSGSTSSSSSRSRSRLEVKRSRSHCSRSSSRSSSRSTRRSRHDISRSSSSSSRVNRCRSNRPQ